MFFRMNPKTVFDHSNNRNEETGKTKRNNDSPHEQNISSGSETEEDIDDQYVAREPTIQLPNRAHTPQKQKAESLDGAKRVTPRICGLPMKRTCTCVVGSPNPSATPAIVSPTPLASQRKVPQCLLSKEELAKIEEERSRKARDLRAQLTESAVNPQNNALSPGKPLLVDVQWDKLPKDGRVVCFDTETTGFARDDEIVEIGGVELVDGIRTGAVFHSYARPRHKFHDGATAVHGLTEELLKDEPPTDFVVASFLDWVGNSALIAHNALFDIRMLSNAVRNAGLEDKFFVSGAYCSMRYFRSIYPGYPSKLEDLGTFLHINERYQRARTLHGALVDAELLAACYQKLIKPKPGESINEKEEEKSETCLCVQGNN